MQRKGRGGRKKPGSGSMMRDLSSLTRPAVSRAGAAGDGRARSDRWPRSPLVPAARAVRASVCELDGDARAAGSSRACWVSVGRKRAGGDRQVFESRAQPASGRGEEKKKGVRFKVGGRLPVDRCRSSVSGLSEAIDSRAIDPPAVRPPLVRPPLMHDVHLQRCQLPQPASLARSCALEGSHIETRVASGRRALVFCVSCTRPTLLARRAHHS